jgi:glycosyltransferase involved in cell wall biosynthesis
VSALAASPFDESGGVSVVICAYDEARWADLQRAVASVVDHAWPGVETIVVVDHNPALLARAEARWPSGVRVTANVHGRGLSGARNTGVEAAAGDVVVFLDDDAAAAPGWLASLLGAFDVGDGRDVVAVGGGVRPAVDGAVPGWWPEEFNWVVGCSWTGLPSEPDAVRNVIGCNMAFRRADLLAVGGFAEGLGRVGTLPAGCEETDVCIRMAHRTPGASILYVPGAAVDHRVPATRLRWRYFWRRCFAEGVSKAAVSKRNRGRAALSSERDYVRRVLPRGVVRALARGNVRRAGAIVLGFAVTCAGYVWGARRRVEQEPRAHGAQRVRVLVVDDGSGVGVWGAQRYLLRLAPLLRERGVDQVLAAPAGSAIAEAWMGAGFEHVDLVGPGDRAVRRGGRGRGTLSAGLVVRELTRTGVQARRVARLAVEVGADVVHANAHWSHLDVAVGARLAQRPSLLLLHEETLPGVAQQLRAVNVRLADGAVAVSDAVRGVVPPWARGRVEVVPNGVDTTAFRPGPVDAHVRAQLAAADPSRPVVLVMCRLDPTKGVDHVIEAVAAVPPHLGVQLAVVGAPSLGSAAWEGHLRELATRLLGDRARFLGHRHDVADLLRAADVLALASSMEGMPLGVLEAQACGTPVVCYPTAGIPEIVDDGRTGLLAHDVASLAGAIERLVTDAGLRARVAAAAREQVVRDHDIALQADRLAEVVHCLASRGAR